MKLYSVFYSASNSLIFFHIFFHSEKLGDITWKLRVSAYMFVYFKATTFKGFPQENALLAQKQRKKTYRKHSSVLNTHPTYSRTVYVA